MFVKTF